MYVVFIDIMYFNVQIIVHHLGILLPHEDGFSKVKNYFESVYYSICDDYYGANANEICMIEDFGPGGETTSRSFPLNNNDA